MKVNNSLQELDLSQNKISDDGMLLIADVLECNNTLTKLNVGKCGISVKGTVVYKTEFKIIFGHFSSCPSLVYLVKQKTLTIPYSSIDAIT